MTDKDDEIIRVKHVIHKVILGFIAVIVIIILFGTVYTIPAGYRGVITTFGKPTMEAQGEGLHFKVPIAQSVHKMNVQTQLNKARFRQKISCLK